MQKLNPKVVIFDLGSTIVDFPVSNWSEVSRECSLAGRKLLCENGYNLPDEKEFMAAFEQVRSEYRNNSKKTLKEWTIVRAADTLFSKLGIESSESNAEKFFDEFYRTLEKHLSLYDDAIETLIRIRKRFEKVGLISNTIFPEKVHHHEFERFALKEFFDFAIFSSTFGLCKPHPDIFLEAARLADEQPSDCVYIGDRFLEDFQGSQGAGMSSILKIVPHWDYPDDVSGSVRKISSLSQLSEHLDI